MNSLASYDTGYVKALLTKHSIKGKCWLFQGSPSNKRYCQLWIRNPGEPRVLVHAHRLSYMAYKGDIPLDYTIDHTCEVGNCINPEHLEAVTVQENIRRYNKNHPTLECPYGHSYTPENTVYLGKRKAKACRACRNARRRKYYESSKLRVEPTANLYCKLGHPIPDGRERCMGKGCKYS